MEFFSCRSKQKIAALATRCACRHRRGWASTTTQGNRAGRRAVALGWGYRSRFWLAPPWSEKARFGCQQTAATTITGYRPLRLGLPSSTSNGQLHGAASAPAITTDDRVSLRGRCSERVFMTRTGPTLDQVLGRLRSKKRLIIVDSPPFRATGRLIHLRGPHPNPPRLSPPGRVNFFSG